MRMQLLGSKQVKDFDKINQKLQQAFSGVKKEEPVQEPVEEEELVIEEPTPIIEEVTPIDEAPEEEDKEQLEEVEVVGDDEEEEEVDEDEEKKEIEQLMKEEDINVVPEDVDLAEIDKLTGVPKSNDIIIGLVPMCAPYSAISTYKYKVKLQAGTHKRGRAQKLIKNLFSQ